ncbi:hypothetical protein Gpo141_00010197 [Globisporangium polare]
MSSSSTSAPVIEDAAVKALLAEHEFLEVVETGEGDQKRVRVRCELTQHEMLPRADAIATHLKSKKFVKAKEWYCYDYSKYEPYIVAHRRKSKSLFCNVTNTVLNRIPAEVEKHVSGKKFQRLKEHVKVTERKGDKKNDDGGDNDEDEDDFDANAFEFENAQVLLSDDEDAVDGVAGALKGAVVKGKKPQNDSDEDDEDGGEGGELEDDDEEDSDMAEFYPDDDDDDDDEGRIDHETVVKLTKRKAEDDDEADKKSEADAPAAKKQKTTKKPAPQVSKARVSSKDRRQQPKHLKASFKK